MMKFITKLVAFTVTFGFSVALIGLPNTFTNQTNQTQRNITSLIERDVRNGDERFSKINFRAERSAYFKEYSEAVNEYVDKSESMNDADLPTDFQSAWREHMKAWRDYSNFLNKCETKRMDDSAFAQLDKNYNQEISITWDEVLRVGREYGATLPY
jgi:hypothetical protein